MEAMLASADAALYVAKQAGRRCWYVNGGKIAAVGRLSL